MSRENGKNASEDAIQSQLERLYLAHLSKNDGESTREWQIFYDNVISISQRRNEYEKIQQDLRLEFHAEKASERRTKLASLLAQTPPFSISLDDRRNAKSRISQRKRYVQFERFVHKYATRDAIGVRPFFASLKRIFEYQGSGNVDRCCRWHLDDAVLMETGTDEWLDGVVWALKGILLFQEDGSIPDDPFLSDAEYVRKWTISDFISDVEYRRLARMIPLHVLPQRGRGSQPLHRLICDEEVSNKLELPTGELSLSNTFRDANYTGGLIERLLDWLFMSWF